MSAGAGKQALFDILNKAMQENTRAVLDINVHIADLNKNTLIRANRLDFTSANAATSEFTKSYNKFIETVDKTVPSLDNFKKENDSLSDVDLAVSIVSNPKIRTANIWLKEERLLISSGFSAMSTIRTKIYSDPNLVNDIYFGKTNRVRSIYQQLEDKGIVVQEGVIPDESTLTALLKNSSSAKGSLYIFPEMTTKNAFGSSINSAAGFKVYELVSEKSGKKSIGVLRKVNNQSFDTVVMFSQDGTPTFYPAKKYIGFKAAVDSTGEIQVYPDLNSNKDAVVLDRRLLSVADVGHAYFIDKATGRTPAGVKLDLPKEILDVFTANSTQLARVNSEIAKLKRRLNRAHGAIDFVFYKDKIQSKLQSSDTNNTFVDKAIVVTFQDYKINSRLSIIENNIIAKFKEIIAKEILKIPGSNTLGQDLIELYSNRVIKPLLRLNNKETKKLKPTSRVAGKKDVNISSNIKQSKGSLQKLSSGSNYNISLPKVQVKTTYIKAGVQNLVNLQNLINQNLVERVKQNMGRGERRDVLNLRTGRFAESVRVERMSQSREGMITAFYSYMKNPYATFSQGGAQDTPKSRDPKLLIARSIREIATQQVANRLRSVSV